VSAIVAMTTQVCGRSVRCCVQSSDVSIQKKISGYFGRFRPLYPGSSDQIEVVSSSDDDAPLVSQHVAATGPAKKKRRLAARDGAAVVLPSRDNDSDAAGGQRCTFEGEAEESSALDDDDDLDSDDSFVVPDHRSCSSAPSDDAQLGAQLRSVCASLRNRRQWVQCAHCWRLVRALTVIVKEIHAVLRSDDDS
jgi:hypothetical protein